MSNDNVHLTGKLFIREDLREQAAKIGIDNPWFTGHLRDAPEIPSYDEVFWEPNVEPGRRISGTLLHVMVQEARRSRG